MKTSLLTTALLVVAVSCAMVVPAIATASPPHHRPHAFPVLSISREGWPLVVAGCRMMEVERTFGFPSQKITADLWVYRSCQPIFPKGKDNCECTILLVEFKDGRVANMKFVNPRALAVITRCVQAQREVIFVAGN